MTAPNGGSVARPTLDTDTAVVVLLDVAAKIVADGYEAQYEAIDIIRDALNSYGIQLAHTPYWYEAFGDWADRIRDQRDAYVAGWASRGAP